MEGRVSLIVYPVRDLQKAKKVYGRFLSTEPYVDGSYYVGFRCGDVEIGLDPRGYERGSAGPICYRDTKDIKQALEDLLKAGASPLQGITDVAGGLLIALAKDADGNILGLRQAP